MIAMSILAGSVSGATATQVSHQGARFDVYQLASGEEQQLTFFWKRKNGTPYGSIHGLRHALAIEGRQLLFVVNGGIFSKQFKLLGLYIENGKRYYQLTRGPGRGNFFLLPNGIFYITQEGAWVVETQDYQPRERVISAI